LNHTGCGCPFGFRSFLARSMSPRCHSCKSFLGVTFLITADPTITLTPIGRSFRIGTRARSGIHRSAAFAPGTSMLSPTLAESGGRTDTALTRINPARGDQR
jgi:hypothetical protein